MTDLSAPKAEAELVLDLQIPPLPEYVAVARLAVATAARGRRSLSEERISDLALAVSEACTNAVEAHQGAREDELVTVRVEEADDRLVLTVEDRGEGFDPFELPSHPAVTDPERLLYERGLGIPIIRTLVDEVTFRSDESGTTVTMVVYAGPAELDDLADIDTSEPETW